MCRECFDLVLGQDFPLFQEWTVDGMESLSVVGAWGGHSDGFNVKSSSVGKSTSGEAVIRWTLELLMSDAGVVVDFMECFANALNQSGFCRLVHLLR